MSDYLRRRNCRKLADITAVAQSIRKTLVRVVAGMVGWRYATIWVMWRLLQVFALMLVREPVTHVDARRS